MKKLTVYLDAIIIIFYMLMILQNIEKQLKYFSLMVYKKIK